MRFHLLELTMNRLKRSFLFSVIVFILLIPTVSSKFASNTKTLTVDDSEMGWYLDRINIKGAWEITTGSPEIVVAVIDAGIDFSNPELTHCQWINEDEKADNGKDDDHNGYIDDRYGWDFVYGDNVPGPDGDVQINGHATFVAGILAAEMDGAGMVGVAPDVTLMNVQVWDYNLYGLSGKLAEAIRYAVDNGADVINFSLDKFYNITDLQDTIKYAYDHNVIMIGASGGNLGGGLNEIAFPGAYDEVIVVGATDYADQLADYNNYGEKLELVAPGGDFDDSTSYWLYSTWYPCCYYYKVGTSFAVPQVTGIVALMKSLNRSITLEKTREILHNTAIDLGTPGKDIYYGYGMVNATAAIQEAEKISEPLKTNYSFLPIIVVLLTSVLISQIHRKKFKDV